MTPPILDIRAVGKAFPGVRALSNLSMQVGRGEVVAFVGENGAGKSTLLKILCGDYTLDEGAMQLDGVDVSHASPLAARKAGFRLVRQEPETVPDISVAKNVFVGECPRRALGRVDFTAMRADVDAMLTRYVCAAMVDPDADGRRLSPAKMNLVEILRALNPGVKVVAFDEPTSSLTSDEVARLFALIRRLAAEGLGIISVSHRLKEVMDISGRVLGLKDCVQTGDLVTREATEDQIIRLIVGRELIHIFQRIETTVPTFTSSGENLTSRWHRGISFEILAGEVLGFGALAGGGAETVDPGRADARCRCGRQGRHLSADRPVVVARYGHHADQFRNAGSAGPV